jgi:hypothetical protein
MGLPPRVPSSRRWSWHRRYSSPSTGFYDPKTFITHAALLRQAFAHCAKFPTAASRGSLDRVSVPVWPIALSGRLPIIALVGRYLTNQLIGRRTLSLPQALRSPGFTFRIPAERSHAVLPLLSERYSPQRGRFPTRYSPVCHASLAGHIRLACVRHAASVHSEPGSNSRFPSLCSRPESSRTGPFICSCMLPAPGSHRSPTAFPFSLSGCQRRPASALEEGPRQGRGLLGRGGAGGLNRQWGNCINYKSTRQSFFRLFSRSAHGGPGQGGRSRPGPAAIRHLGRAG